MPTWLTSSLDSLSTSDAIASPTKQPPTSTDARLSSLISFLSTIHMSGFPDSRTSPDWSPHRRRSTVPERNQTAPRPWRAADSESDPSPAPDTPCTVGEPLSEAAPLPIREFSQLARAPGTVLTFDGPGGVLALERDDVHRIELEGLPDTTGMRVPRRLLLAANTGSFQVPSFLKSARAFVLNLKESRYGARMNDFLATDIIDVPI